MLTSILENEVNIASNQLVDTLALNSLDRVVSVINSAPVVPKVQGKHVRPCHPPSDSCEGPCVKDHLGLYIKAQHSVLGYSQQLWFPIPRPFPSLYSNQYSIIKGFSFFKLVEKMCFVENLGDMSIEQGEKKLQENLL